MQLPANDVPPSPMESGFAGFALKVVTDPDAHPPQPNEGLFHGAEPAQRNEACEWRFPGYWCPNEEIPRKLHNNKDSPVHINPIGHRLAYR